MISNIEGTLFPSVPRAVAQAYNSADQTNTGARGVRVFIDVTAITSTPSVVFTLTVKDPVSGTYTAILTTAAIATVSHTVLTVYPGATVSAGITLSNVLSGTWRLTATHGNTNSITYTAGFSLIE